MPSATDRSHSRGTQAPGSARPSSELGFQLAAGIVKTGSLQQPQHALLVAQNAARSSLETLEILFLGLWSQSFLDGGRCNTDILQSASASGRRQRAFCILLRRPARRREDEYASGRVAPVGACGNLRQEGQGTLRVRGAFLASEELAQEVVEDFAGNFDDVLVPRDSQLSLVILWQQAALDDHGVAIGDDDSGA